MSSKEETNYKFAEALFRYAWIDAVAQAADKTKKAVNEYEKENRS